MSDQSDPKIVERLGKLPPYNEAVEDEPQSVEETDANQEDIQLEEETQEETQPEEELNEEEPTIETDNERTAKEFEKLKQANQKLKKEVEESKKYSTNVLDSLKPQPVPPVAPPYTPPVAPVAPQQPQQPTTQLYDDEGYVNPQALSEMDRRTQEALAMALQAKREAEESKRRAEELERQKMEFEETTLMQRIHQEYPEMDPNNESYNETLYEAVRNELVRQMIEGKNDVEGAVKYWYPKLITNNMNKQQAQKKAEQKSQILATNPSSSRPSSTTTTELSDLQKRTRLGDRNALMERLKAIKS